MNTHKFLMPRSFRFVGIFIFIGGLLLGVARFRYGWKPGILDLKMFAFYSSYLENKYLEFIGNNLAEEFTGLFLISGLFLMAFSREKNENERTNELRFKAFFLAYYLNFLFLLIALFFTFGFAFVYMLIVNMGVGLLFYLASFRILLFRDRAKSSNRINQ